MNQRLFVVFEYFDKEFTTNFLHKLSLNESVAPRYISYFLCGGPHEKKQIACEIVVHPVTLDPGDDLVSLVEGYRQVHLVLRKEDPERKIKEMFFRQMFPEKLHSFVPEYKAGITPLRPLLYKLANAYNLRQKRRYYQAMSGIQKLLDFDSVTEAKLALMGSCWQKEEIARLLHNGSHHDLRIEKSLKSLLQRQEVLGQLYLIKDNEDPGQHVQLLENLNKVLFTSR